MLQGSSWPVRGQSAWGSQGPRTHRVNRIHINQSEMPRKQQLNWCHQASVQDKIMCSLRWIWVYIDDIIRLTLSLSLSPRPSRCMYRMPSAYNHSHILPQSFIYWCTSTVNICAWPMRHADMPANDASSAASLLAMACGLRRPDTDMALRSGNCSNKWTYWTVHQLPQDAMKSSDGCETQRYSNTNAGRTKIRLLVERLQAVGMTWWHSATCQLVSSDFSCLDSHVWIWEAVSQESKIMMIAPGTTPSRLLTTPHITMLLPNDIDIMPYFAFIRRA